MFENTQEAAPDKPANPFFEYESNSLIEMYVKLRDTVKLADDEHKKKTKAARDMLGDIEAAMLSRLNTLNVDSMKSPAGTMYRTHRKSATLADASAFKEFVIANDAWELTDWKANAPAVADFIEEHKVAPPGVNYGVAYTVGVRRS